MILILILILIVYPILAVCATFCDASDNTESSRGIPKNTYSDFSHNNDFYC
jgi:hypothetical protein